MRKNQKLMRAIVGATPVVAGVLIGAASSKSYATLLFYETMNYPSGNGLNLDVADGTAAGTAPWIHAAGTIAPVVTNASGSLSYSGLATSGDSFSLQYDGSSVAAATGESARALGSTYTTGTLYYSALLKVTALGANGFTPTAGNWTAGSFMAGLKTLAPNATSAVGSTGAPLLIRPGDAPPGTQFPSTYQLGTSRTATSGDRQWVTGQTFNIGPSGDTVLVVLKYDLGATSAATDDSASLFLNPTPGIAEPAASLTVTGGTGLAAGGLQAMFVRNNGVEPDIMLLDELRVGTSWGDVTPASGVYWDIDGATAGAGGATPSGTWDSSTANWTSDAAGATAGIAWPSGASATFSAASDATGAYTVTVSGTQTAAGLSFEDGSPTLTGGTVNLSGVLTPVISASTGVTVVIDSTVTGSQGISKAAGGTLVLTGAMNYTGATTISAGTLQVGNGGTAGALPTTSAITNNGTLAFNQTDTVTQGTDFGNGISGTGNVTQAGLGGTLILNAANTYSGTTNATAGTLTIAHAQAIQNSILNTDGGGALVFDNALTDATIGGLQGAGAYTAPAAMNLTVGHTTTSASYSGNIGGTGSLTKTAANTQTLEGTNTYQGGTTINAGTLAFNQRVSMPNTGTVTVNSGGTLSVRASSNAAEWSDATSGTGSLGDLIAGVGGQGTANQVEWKAGSTLGISTINAGVSGLTYAGAIGSFYTGTGTTDNVNLLKRGTNTKLVLTGNNTLSGQLRIDNDSGIVAISGTNANLGDSLTTSTPAVNIGFAAGTALDGSNDTGVKLLANNALPADALIGVSTSVTNLGPDAPSSLFQLYDGFATVGNAPSGPSFNQTIRGITGGAGRIKVGLGTLTIDVPGIEQYSFTGTIRTDQSGGNRGTVIKTGTGEQDIGAAGAGRGDFILQQGTIGIAAGGAFGDAADNGRLFIQGGTIKTTAASVTVTVPYVEISSSFSADVGGPSGDADWAFSNSEIKLTMSPTITVNLPTGDGQLISAGHIEDGGLNYGFTKAGLGTLIFQFNSLGNNYTGDTIIQQGALRTSFNSRIGDSAGSSDVYLAGGQLEYQAAAAGLVQAQTLNNPIHVTGNSKIVYNTTLNNVTDTSDTGGIPYIFSSNTFDWSSGTLTFQNLSSAAGNTVTFRPQFTGSGFDYAGPVVITNGSATKGTVLEFGNTSGTQSWSGAISGNGGMSRLSNGATVLAGSSILIGSATTGISIADNSSIQVLENTGTLRMVRTGTLTIGTSSSQLDLENNRMFVTAHPQGAGTFVGIAYTGVAGLVRSGMNPLSGDPTWTGSGIVTTQSNAGFGTSSVATTLAVARAGDVGKTTFGGQTVAANDALVMYTYNGDANLSGSIDADDYFQIDSNYNKSGTAFGFNNGDFNYDGVINGDDFALIDAGYAASQSGPAFPAAPPAGVTAVPEPTGVTLLALAAATLARRRRRA